MSLRKLSTPRKLLLVLCGGLSSLVILELAARVIYRGPRWLNPVYVQISQGFPDLDKLIIERDAGPNPRYYDEFLYAAPPVATETVNFTEYYSARLTPASVPLANAEHIVWTFGGSTMENTETTDHLSIANTWARVFNRNLGPTHVKNFGTGGFFSSYELIKFQKILREVPAGERPSMAIFFDGYNDALFGFQYGPGSLQKDLSLKLQAFVEGDYVPVSLYTASRWLSKYSKLWEKTGGRAAEYFLFPLPEPDTEDLVLASTVRIYTRNVRLIGATCTAFEIRCFFILQPLLLTKQPLTPVEQQVLDGLEGHPRFGPEGIQFIREFYRATARELAGRLDFIDASSIMNGRSEPDFYDTGHTGVLTAPVIGERTAELILERLRPTSPN